MRKFLLSSPSLLCLQWLQVCLLSLWLRDRNSRISSMMTWMPLVLVMEPICTHPASLRCLESLFPNFLTPIPNFHLLKPISSRVGCHTCLRTQIVLGELWYSNIVWKRGSTLQNLTQSWEYLLETKISNLLNINTQECQKSSSNKEKYDLETPTLALFEVKSEMNANWINICFAWSLILAPLSSITQDKFEQFIHTINECGESTSAVHLRKMLQAALP